MVLLGTLFTIDRRRSLPLDLCTASRPPVGMLLLNLRCTRMFFSAGIRQGLHRHLRPRLRGEREGACFDFPHLVKRPSWPADRALFHLLFCSSGRAARRMVGLSWPRKRVVHITLLRRLRLRWNNSCLGLGWVRCLSGHAERVSRGVVRVERVCDLSYMKRRWPVPSNLNLEPEST